MDQTEPFRATSVPRTCLDECDKSHSCMLERTKQTSSAGHILMHVSRSGRFLCPCVLHHAVLRLRHPKLSLRWSKRQSLLAVDDGGGSEQTLQTRSHPEAHQPLRGVWSALCSCGVAWLGIQQPASVSFQLDFPVDRILLHYGEAMKGWTKQ